MAAGKVWLVGAGPGDIGLFTLKGAAVLQQADVVVYDSLVGEGVLAKIPEHARLINVGKRANHHTMVQEDINKVLLEEAEKGKEHIVSDAFSYGSYSITYRCASLQFLTIIHIVHTVFPPVCPYTVSQ